MKNNLTKYKVWQIIGVAVLCAVCVLTAVLGIVFGMNLSNVDSNNVADIPTDPIVMEMTESKNISLMSGVATTADDGTVTKTVTATVTPANVVRYDKLVWEISFKNADSAWARGKNLSEYVTISVSEDSLTCTVTCKKAFSESVVINVKDRLESASASLAVDYYKRLVSYQVEILGDFGDSQILDSSNSQDSPAAVLFASKTTRVPGYSFKYTLTFGDGTVENTTSFILSSRAGDTTLVNGKNYEFDEQSEIDWEYDSYYVELSYGGTLLSSWQIELIPPLNSISLSQSTITF